MPIERRVTVITDDSPMDPREWDCVGRMLCFHRKYNLGDKHNYDADDCKEQLACEADDSLADKLDYTENEMFETFVHCHEYDGGEDYTDAAAAALIAGIKLREALVDRAFDAGYAALPLYLYDHSGITMSTGRFNCPWDSGRVGLIVCDRETVDREFDGDRGKALRALEAEVKAYDDYITGNIYVLLAEEREDDGEWACVDSVGGIDGDYVTDAAVDFFGEDYLGVDIIYK